MENENLKCYNDECPRYDPEERDGSNCSTLSSAFLKSCRTYDDGTIDEIPYGPSEAEIEEILQKQAKLNEECPYYTCNHYHSDESNNCMEYGFVGDCPLFLRAIPGVQHVKCYDESCPNYNPEDEPETHCTSFAEVTECPNPVFSDETEPNKCYDEDCSQFNPEQKDGTNCNVYPSDDIPKCYDYCDKSETMSIGSKTVKTVPFGKGEPFSIEMWTTGDLNENGDRVLKGIVSTISEDDDLPPNLVIKTPLNGGPLDPSTWEVIQGAENGFTVTSKQKGGNVNIPPMAEPINTIPYGKPISAEQVEKIKFSLIHERMDENEENLSQSLSILNRNIKEIREYLETVNKNYQEIGKDIYDSNQSIIKHNMSVSALADQVEASVEEFKKDMKTEKHNRDYTFKELLSRIGRLENDVRILDDRITGMQNRNQRRDKEIFELEASRSIDDDTDNNQEIRNVAIENRIKILETPEKPSKNIKK